MMDSKTDLRIKAKDIRKTLNICTISEKIVAKIRKNDLYKSAKNVMLYYPMKYEINLLELLNDNKNFYLPRVKGNNLEVCPYRKGDELKKSSFSIMEPLSEAVSKDKSDLIIVPALMADKKGYRLGYGGGFYDRFIKGNKTSFKTLCPVAKELFVDKLPADKFDIKIDEIIYA